jgi:hypothetical protein
VGKRMKHFDDLERVAALSSFDVAHSRRIPQKKSAEDSEG